MDNPEILATVGPQDTGHTQSKTKWNTHPRKKNNNNGKKQTHKTKHNTENKNNKSNTPRQKSGVNPGALER